MPKLVAIDGPLKGATFSLSGEEFSIGRSSSNSLPILSDPMVSRDHCVLRRTEQRFCVADRDSHNGTFVNGVPVRVRVLEHGDQLTVGASVFAFVTEAASGEAEARPRAKDSDLTVTAGRSAVLRAIESSAAEGRSEQDVRTLLAISAAIASIRAVRPLAECLAELLLESIPARTSAVALWESGELVSAAAWDRYDGPITKPPPSPALAENCMGQHAAVRNQASRRMAAPLVCFGKRLGLICLETDDAEIRFDERHARLLTAVADIAAVALDNAQRMQALEGENERLRAELTIQHRMIGDSAAMRRVYDFIGRIAPLDSTVLITGESGTGKELAARALHDNSPRNAKPFVAINCAVLTETLLESELFGHERGAFTGAVAQKKGKLEVAEGGTVFLDEVGELAPSLQAKLLRVLQEREFERLGGVRPIQLEARLVAATNSDLAEAVRQGRFRQDLYFRLNVISIGMPPLRDRRDDIPLLANYFRVRHSARVKRHVTGISARAHERLQAYGWPGNVRELESAIESAVALGSTETILEEDLPDGVLQGSPDPHSSRFQGALMETKKRLIEEAYQRARGDYIEAAKLLGLHPNSLLRLVRNLNLKGTV